MKGFEKGLSPSRPNAKRSVSSSGSVENNENDSSVDKLISKFESHKIESGRRSISGSPRKKILAEIKDIPEACDVQDHKNPNQELGKSLPKRAFGGVVSCYSNGSEPKDDSSLKVYDPLTNYLSPRPQYLRYNPNRRREIVERFEEECSEELNRSPESVEVNDEESSVEEIEEELNRSPEPVEVNDEESSVEEIEDSSLSPQKVCVINQNNEGICEEDKDNEGICEEDNDNVVDDYEAEEDEEGIEEERGWCLKVLKLLLTLIACLLSTSYICSMNSPKDSPIQQTIWEFKDGGFMIKNDTLEFVTTKLKDDGFFGVEVGDNYAVVEEEENNGGEIDKGFEAEIVESLELQEEMIENENVDIEDMVDAATAAEFKNIRDDEVEFKEDECDRLIDAKIEDEAAKTEFIAIDEVNTEPQSSEQLMAETLESEDATGYVLEMDPESSNKLEGAEELLESISEKIPMNPEGIEEIESLEACGSNGDSSDSMDESDEIGDSSDSMDAQLGFEKSKWETSIVVVASAIGIVSTLLAFIYRSKKSRNTSALNQDYAVERNVNQVVLPSTERKVEFLARAPEASGELGRYIQAPSVELIGEIVVGQPSSLGRSKKYQMTISENEFNATLCQNPQMVSATPTTSSTSYGSFTTETKISKKEGGQSREAVFETTPVRRSSRLRNRSAVKS